ncbi:MAG: ABC transporter permease subunit [Thermococci archaeon]|nr:ABC transporter permease subunit [Thermococci archaeon]
MLWGTKLELKQSLRTKKFIIIVIMMSLLYVPALYGLKKLIAFMSPQNRPMNVAMSSIVSSMKDLTGFFIALLALLLGVMAINASVRKGTMALVMSRPVKRRSYLLQKFLAHTIILTVSVLVSAAVALIGIRYLGFSVRPSFVGDVLLFSMVILLAMIQFLALGYLISTLVRSTSAAVGIAVALFLVMLIVVPLLVQTTAASNAHRLAREKFQNGNAIGNYTLGSNYETYFNHEKNRLMRRYRTYYLFLDPISQVNMLVSNLSEIVYITRINSTFYHAKYNSSLRMYLPDKSRGIVWRSEKEFTMKNGCPSVPPSGLVRVNGTAYYKMVVESCYRQTVYAGVWHSIAVNRRNLILLLIPTFVYLFAAVYRFNSMDLR